MLIQTQLATLRDQAHRLAVTYWVGRHGESLQLALAMLNYRLALDESWADKAAAIDATRARRQYELT